MLGAASSVFQKIKVLVSISLYGEWQAIYVRESEAGLPGGRVPQVCLCHDRTWGFADGVLLHSFSHSDIRACFKNEMCMPGLKIRGSELV